MQKILKMFLFSAFSLVVAGSQVAGMESSKKIATPVDDFSNDVDKKVTNTYNKDLFSYYIENNNQVLKSQFPVY